MKGIATAMEFSPSRTDIYILRSSGKAAHSFREQNRYEKNNGYYTIPNLQLYQEKPYFQIPVNTD